jgi:ABC-2 type transport system ATP-binding protein
VLSHDGDHIRVELGPGIDDQAVLRAALAAGPVHEFGRYRPALTELYRDVVSTPVKSEPELVTA